LAVHNDSSGAVGAGREVVYGQIRCKRLWARANKKHCTDYDFRMKKVIFHASLRAITRCSSVSAKMPDSNTRAMWRMTDASSVEH
jgi:hypothetical protein